MARNFVDMGILWSQNGANGQNGYNGTFRHKWCEWSEWLEWYFQTLLVVTSEDGFSSQHAGLLHLRWACFTPKLWSDVFLEIMKSRKSGGAQNLPNAQSKQHHWKLQIEVPNGKNAS